MNDLFAKHRHSTETAEFVKTVWQKYTAWQKQNEMFPSLYIDKLLCVDGDI